MDKYRLQFVSHPNHELPHFTNTWKYFQTWNSQAPTFLQLVPFARSNYILDQLSSITWRYSTNVDAEWKQKTEAELTSRGFVLPAQLCYSRRLLTFPFPFRTRKYYILRDEGSKRGMEIWSEISFDSQLLSNLLSANCVIGGGGGFNYISLEGEVEKLVNTKFSGDERGCGMTLFRENSVKLSCNLVEFGEGASRRTGMEILNVPS